jgi:hypothetical protein
MVAEYYALLSDATPGLVLIWSRHQTSAKRIPAKIFNFFHEAFAQKRLHLPGTSRVCGGERTDIRIPCKHFGFTETDV